MDLKINIIIVNKLMQQLKDFYFEEGDPFITEESLCNPSWRSIKADISCLQQNNFLDQ